MTAAAPPQYVTPVAPSLTLRSAGDPSRQQTVQRGERLRVVDHLSGGFVELEFAGGRWLAQERDVTRWQGEAVRPNAPPTPSTPYTAGPDGNNRVRDETPRFPGGVVVGRVFVILGFILIVVGALLALLLESSYSCGNAIFATTCQNDGQIRIALFVAPVLVFLFYALPLMAIGYVLLFLNSIEVNTRG